MATANTERVTVRMVKGDPNADWGFRLFGGAQEYGGQLIIGKVFDGGLANRAGLLEGDRVVQIAGVSTSNLRNNMAADSVINQCGNALDIVVERPATRIWKPQVTPVDVAPGDMTSPPVKYSLVHNEAPRDYPPAGSGHNVEARPFGQPQHAPLQAPPAVQPPQRPQPPQQQQQQQQRYSSSSTTMSNTIRKIPDQQQQQQYASPMPQPASQPKSKVDEYLQKTGGLFGTDPKLAQKVLEPAYLRSETLRLIKECEPTSRSSSIGPPTTTIIGQSAESQKGQTADGRGPAVPAGPTSTAPTCDHCGRLIHGLFCTVEGKTLHGECFKCSTCGSRLKNVGYFSINDKLYCDVHARQQTNRVISTQQPKLAPKTRDIPVQYLSISGNEQPQQQNRNYNSSSSSYHQYHHHKTTTSTSSNNTANNQQQQPPPPAISVTSPPLPLAPNSKVSSSSNNYAISNTMINANASAPHTNIPVGKPPARRGRGILKEPSSSDAPRIPVCEACNREIRGPFVLALNKCWCPEHFVCASGQCQRQLLDTGFIEENGMIYCEGCYEKYFAPTCSKCARAIIGDCLTALERQWHPECFVCTHCRAPFGSTSFFVENGQPYCEKDWNQLFTTKCYACQFPIESGDRWVEALNNAYHSDCFNCSVCQKNLEGQSFYAKAGRPYCKAHA